VGKRLTEFIEERRRAECPVCQLPDELRDQFKVAARRKVPTAVVLEWLKVEHGVTISEEEYLRHGKSRHGPSLKRGRL